MAILIVNRYPIVRYSLQQLLGAQEAYQPILEADSVGRAMELVAQVQPSVIILDIQMGDESGFGLLKEIIQEPYGAKCIIMTASTSRLDFKHAKNYPIKGYIRLDDYLEDIVYGIRVVHRGGKYFSTSLLEEYTDQVYRIKGLTLR